MFKGAPALERRICLYCERPNHVGNYVCDGCAAPLRDREREPARQLLNWIPEGWILKSWPYWSGTRGNPGIAVLVTKDGQVTYNRQFDYDPQLSSGDFKRLVQTQVAEAIGVTYEALNFLTSGETSVWTYA